MSKHNDGGPAFPWDGFNRNIAGMSLRDYFAGQVATGLLRDLGFCPWGNETAEQLATMAYDLADAMLAEREKTK